MNVAARWRIFNSHPIYLPERLVDGVDRIDAGLGCVRNAAKECTHSLGCRFETEIVRYAFFIVSNNETVRVSRPQQRSGLRGEVLSFLRRGRLYDDAILRRAGKELAVLILGAFNAKEGNGLCSTVCRPLLQEVPQLDIALARPITKHSQRHRTNLA